MPAVTHWFSGAALGAFLALVATTSTLTFAWYRAALNEADTAKKVDAAEREATRLNTAKEQLGAFLAEGSALLGRTQKEQEPAPLADAEAWAQRTERYLKENFGSAHVVRFRDASGLPPGITSLSSQERIRLESGLKVRLSRLQQFLSEMPAPISNK